ncbi:unnamed protein product [Paramecium sonneborni]|uniref:Uncharacterized protein n=1 Tax=Paramecium sonneborni TaxID=65129 RepID=A0A8S1N426_9CILI|nr:unnamed protein product [Paramecium sonneborni]
MLQENSMIQNQTIQVNQQLLIHKKQVNQLLLIQIMMVQTIKGQRYQLKACLVWCDANKVSKMTGDDYKKVFRCNLQTLDIKISTFGPILILTIIRVNIKLKMNCKIFLRRIQILQMQILLKIIQQKRYGFIM